MNVSAENISSIAEKSGIPRWEVAALIRHYRIPTKRLGPSTVVDGRDMPALIEILRRHPGFTDTFAQAG